MEKGRDRIFYDTEKDVAFRDALIDLVIEAYATQLHKDAAAGETTARTIHDEEVEMDGHTIEYGFYAEPGKGAIELQSIIRTPVLDIHSNSKEFMQDEIQESNIDTDRKIDFVDAGIDDSVVESFMRRTFSIWTLDRKVNVQTDIGYMVDGLEVDRPEQSDEGISSPVLDLHDFMEVVRALYMMELIDDEKIREFVDTVT